LKVVIDIETNSLINPTKIWVVVCKNIETNTYHIFRNITEDRTEHENLTRYLEQLRTEANSLLIGHNLLGFDLPVLSSAVQLHSKILPTQCIDTLIISKLVDYPRQGHSIESYGLEFSLPKIHFNKFTEYSQEMEDYCVRDVNICHRIYSKYLKYISNPRHQDSIRLEHEFQIVVNNLHDNGFCFNSERATALLAKVKHELSILDKDILEAFPPKLKLIREVTPKETKYGTISLTSIPKDLRNHTEELSIDSPFSYCTWQTFNPSSHKQIISVLNQANWRPVDKTQTHIDTERELSKLKYTRRTPELDTRLQELYAKHEVMKKAGWKVNETNLETLPQTAPLSARTLAKRILLESRRRTLSEWLALVQPDGRIHGKFYGIGAWTHRMAHQNPNTANIPNEFDTNNNKKLYGKELRSLWCAAKNRLLVGVDAEGIQLRIFAHYINDPEFTRALVEGKKENGSDPHTLNQKILGSVCKSRQAAKRFIYALLLGAGSGKLTEILGCTSEEMSIALERLMGRYQGFAHLKTNVIPADAIRGWFSGLDGRKIRIPGDTISQRRHLCMSGYLQSGEAIVMKLATLKWWQRLESYGAKLVNLVHDEWQVECPNNMTTALHIANLMANSLSSVGEELMMKCPLSGSYWNDTSNDYTIAPNWSKTH